MKSTNEVTALCAEIAEAARGTKTGAFTACAVIDVPLLFELLSAIAEGSLGVL